MTFSMGMFVSCDDDETYADQKRHESEAINSFIKNGALETLDDDTILYVPPIKVISQKVFEAQDSVTDVSKNEYVLLSSTGVYMQIVNKGVGEKLKHGQTVSILNRYIEYNIMGDSIFSLNDKVNGYVANNDKMTVTNTYGVFSGSFVSGVMMTMHGYSYIPEGWLIPLAYINLTRDLANIAKVRLIVPHTSGTSDASSNVIPFFYEISYQLGRN